MRRTVNPVAGMVRIGMVGIVMVGMMFGSTATAQIREAKPNLIGGELLGRGLIVTLNYERFVSNAVGFGAGLMAIGTSDGSGILLPLYASFTPGDVHSLYLSAGTTYVGGGDQHDYEDQFLITFALGYQFHSQNGFFVRPLFTLLLPTEGGGDEFLIWPGITIGGSF